MEREIVNKEPLKMAQYLSEMVNNNFSHSIIHISKGLMRKLCALVLES